MRKLALVLVLASLVVVGCGDDYKGDATIVGREYDDPDDVWISGTYHPESCSGGYGSVPRTCTPGWQSPGYWMHFDERFLLKVEWTDDEGKHHSSKREAPRSAYDDCPDGRVINLETMKCPLR